MISHGIPDTFVDIMVLAGVIIFAITTLSALLCSIFVTRNNLLYLGLQLALLFIVLSMSENWSYPLWFDAIFATLEDFHQTVRALLILSIGFTIDMAIRFFVWDVMIKRDGRLAVPKLLVAVIRALIYLFAGLTIMQFVYGQSITALATLSGAFALIIGLSAQSTLGEMFAGIAIALSQPFRVGDWVKVGSLDEGQVVDMTWRLVRIETRDRNIINVTNRVVSDSPVK
ncbi:MAG: mechanosensitive ion channel, partial [Rhodospirillales bacterium]|nr:mechanosensitive ion channel [Rhodospirillales bacterium]